MGLPEFDLIGTYHTQAAAIIAGYRDGEHDYNYARMLLDSETNDFCGRAVAGGIKKSQICSTVLTQYRDLMLLAETREDELYDKTIVYRELMDIAKHVLDYDEKLSVCMISDMLPAEYKPVEYEPYEQPASEGSVPDFVPEDW